MKLRPYQSECVSAVLDAYRAGTKSVLCVLATGLGKTVIFAEVARLCVSKGKRVLVIAHREELINQAADKIHRVVGEQPDIEMADMYARNTLMGKSPVVVSSVQTQIAPRGDGRRLHRFDPSEFGLVIIDEAHHAPADSYRVIIDHYRQVNPDVKILGVTATPDRGDGEALKGVFDSCVYDYGVLNGVRDGWLVPIMQQYVQVDSLDFSGVHTTAGDLNPSELAAVMEYEAHLHGVAEATVASVGDRRTLVFAASVHHAQRLAEILNRKGPDRSRVVTGKTPKDERRQMLRDYSEGRFQYLVNVGVATEGFDEPGISAVVMARPTKSRALYSQMLGRGTRPLPATVDGIEVAEARRSAIAVSAKPDMLVVDFVGNAGRHKLIHAVDVLGGHLSERAIKLAEKRIQTSKPESVFDAVARAEIEERRAAERLEEQKRRGITARVKYKTVAIDPFDALDLEAPRAMMRHERPASDKQAALLRKFGVEGAEAYSARDARRLIGEIFARRERGLCTLRQAALLRKFGVDGAGNMTYEAAKTEIDSLKRAGWRRVEGASA